MRLCKHKTTFLLLTSLFRIKNDQVIKGKFFWLTAYLNFYGYPCCLKAWYISIFKLKPVFVKLIISIICFFYFLNHNNDPSESLIKLLIVSFFLQSEFCTKVWILISKISSSIFLPETKSELKLRRHLFKKFIVISKVPFL